MLSQKKQTAVDCYKAALQRSYGTLWSGSKFTADALVFLFSLSATCMTLIVFLCRA